MDLELHETNEAIMERIMNEYGRRVVHLVYLIVKNRTSAEDIAQEVFVKVYRHLPSFRGESSIQTWIYRIAINEAKKHVRSWYVRNIFPSLFGEYLHTQKEQDETEPLVMKQVERKEFVQLVLKLPLSYRQVIVLHYYQDLSIEEVAHVLEASQGAVRNKLYRGRKKLKQLLEREGLSWTSIKN
ncbi:sigma-70 family RNA polymerase sigma factor [Brevibacillus laterosporus]|uniref:sigma-70 family RNA polymerase sigma factor n=1 Tax=Brevibacillus laterosporus TaxID=1465 RepID=UPI001443AB9F|nr:sigma-70 family RNA polymerase sigma factor [Brevibacillus laterosporus]NKQ22645.1 sigma-70 family RNA polymerase sigma factor [Brevibacillus laterosporus]WNX30375.1 sigma-70 family RNA polymerase sigma factor [Brevibacillus laterosporus]